MMENAWRTEFAKKYGGDYPFSSELEELVNALEEDREVEVHIRTGPAYGQGGQTALGRTFPSNFPKSPIIIEINPAVLATCDWRETLVHELIHVLIFIHDKCPDSKILNKKPTRQIIDLLTRCRGHRRSLHQVFDYTIDKETGMGLHNILVRGLLAP